jgi:hypothetical protein
MYGIALGLGLSQRSAACFGVIIGPQRARNCHRSESAEIGATICFRRISDFDPFLRVLASGRQIQFLPSSDSGQSTSWQLHSTRCARISRKVKFCLLPSAGGHVFWHGHGYNCEPNLMGDFSRLECGAVFHRRFDSRRAVGQIGVLPEETRVVSRGKPKADK